MITGNHGVIRGSEVDDALALKRVYDSARPRAALLDRRHELLVPTQDELRELLSQKETLRGVLYAVEDLAGNVRGFCTLRVVNPQVSYTELVVMLYEGLDYEGPLADEVFAFLAGRAFDEAGLNKMMSQSLDSETAYRAFLVRHGFERSGVQREAMYSAGRYRHLESWALFRTRYQEMTAVPQEVPCQ